MEPIKNTIKRDRIGEIVDLDKCPECNEHPDCFCRMEGRCTALNENGGESCAFYQPERAAVDKAKAAFMRLRDIDRTDLIRKYIKPLTAMGMLDDEINDFDRTAEELDEYRHSVLDALMEQESSFEQDFEQGFEQDFEPSVKPFYEPIFEGHING